MRNYSSQPINNNNFSNGSPIYELYNLNSQGTSTVNAENNWWGTAIESEIQAKIYDWFDDATKGIVDYTPWDTTIRTDAPISPPTGLTATITAPGTIALSWNANPESDTAGYKVYWDTDSGYPYANSVDVGNVTSYTITGITNGIAAAVTAHDTGYNPANDDPNTIVNENQTNGNESWFSNEFADLSPATTTASPSGGTYGTSVSVTLSCNDGTGSGCANTYYCLGTGCTPTTQYTGGTINITSSTDLRFYSTDNAGNSEGIKTEIYAITYNLAVNKSGSGSVASTSPADVIIDCGDICGENYNQGTLVTLVATPDSGSTFAGWSGDCDSNGQVTMNADKTCIATFAGIPNISASPTSLNFGNVNVNTTSTSQTVTVTNTGTANLSISAVTLTGTNSSEYTKQVDTCAGNTLPPSQGCSVQIVFTPASAGAKTAGLAITSNDPDTPALDIPVSGNGISQYTLTVEKTGTGSGTVTSSPLGIDCGTDCTEAYASGTPVTLTATPDTGSTFTGWTGCDSVSGNTCDVTITSDKTITATFIPSALYVVWADDTYGNNEIFLKKSTDGGNTWVFQRITNNTGNSQAPVVAVNGNEVYVVWQDDTYAAGVPEIFLKKSTDNGATWMFQRLTNNTGVSMNPSIRVNGNNVYVVWQDDTYGNNEIFLKRSTDSGATWAFQRLTNNTGNSQAPVVAVNGNEVYVVWQDDTYAAGVPEIFLKKSTDNGATWSFQRLTNNAGISGRPSMVLSSSNIYVVWQDDTYGNNEIFLKKSTDGGATWTFQRLTNNAGQSINPSIRVNGNDVYAVWMDDTYGPSGASEIFLKKSTDNGATWQFQRLTNNTGNSAMPAMAR